MSRTATFTWPLDPHLKERIEAAAKAEDQPVGMLLKRTIYQWLATAGPKGPQDEAEQEAVRADLMSRIGRTSSGRTVGSVKIKEVDRRIIAEKRERRRERASPTRTDR